MKYVYACLILGSGTLLYVRGLFVQAVEILLAALCLLYFVMLILMRKGPQ